MTTYQHDWPLDGTNLATPCWQPTSPLLTDVEAARYLLLAEGKDDDAAVKAINRLVDSRKVRPCLIGGRRRFSKVELDRCIADVTDGWNP